MAHRSDFAIGQTVWRASTEPRNQTLTTGTITKIGRKYITVDNTYQFDIDSLDEHVKIG